MMIIAKVLVAFWYGFRVRQVMEQSVSKPLPLADPNSEILRYMKHLRPHIQLSSWRLVGNSRVYRGL